MTPPNPIHHQHEMATSPKTLKRRLSSVLTALDSSLHTSSSSLPLPAQPPPKKTKSRSTEFDTPKLTKLIGKKRLAKLRLKPATEVEIVRGKGKEVDPNNLEGLINRIGSYKPNYVSSSLPVVELAGRGWISQGVKDELSCAVCMGKLYTADMDQIQKQLVENHQPFCHWKNRGCSPLLYSSQFNQGSKRIYEDWKKRYGTFVGLEILPELKVELLDEGEMEKFKLAVMGKLSEGEIADEKGMTMALFGWTAQDISSPSSTTTPPTTPKNQNIFFSCPLCSRRTPSWSSSKAFDVSNEHRVFCPFILSTASTPPTEMGLSSRTPSRIGQQAAMEYTNSKLGKPGWRKIYDALVGGREGGGRERLQTKELLGYVRGLLGPPK